MFKQKGLISIKNNSKHFFCFLFILSLLIQGCTSVGKVTKPSQVAKIEIGKTTKENILSLLGLPNEREFKTLKENKLIEFWIYYEGRGRRSVQVTVPTGVIPAGSLIFVSGVTKEINIEEGKNIAVIIAFDENNIVVDIKTEGD